MIVPIAKIHLSAINRGIPGIPVVLKQLEPSSVNSYYIRILIIYRVFSFRNYKNL